MIFIIMNLSENIKRIKSIMEQDKDKLKDLLYPLFDKFFNDHNINNVGENEFEWLDKNNQHSFSKNPWGRFWVFNCDNYKKISNLSKFVSISENEFNSILIGYLNEKYGTLFGKKPIRDIKLDCSDSLEWL
jgi:hypothetical protein